MEWKGWQTPSRSMLLRCWGGLPPSYRFVSICWIHPCVSEIIHLCVCVCMCVCMCVSVRVLREEILTIKYFFLEVVLKATQTKANTTLSVCFLLLTATKIVVQLMRITWEIVYVKLQSIIQSMALLKTYSTQTAFEEKYLHSFAFFTCIYTTGTTRSSLRKYPKHKGGTAGGKVDNLFNFVEWVETSHSIDVPCLIFINIHR